MTEDDNDKIWGKMNFEQNSTFYLLNKGYHSINFEKIHGDPFIPDSFIK